VRSAPLDDINPDTWSPAYTTELLALLNVLGRLVQLEPKQAELLERIRDGHLITVSELEQARVLPAPIANTKPLKEYSDTLFDLPS
jgi:hypothetical protein